MKSSAGSLRFCCVALMGFLLVPRVSAGSVLDSLFGANELETITVTDVTPAGNLLRRPTADHPLYYMAVSAGYNDFGGIKAGEKPIARQTVDKTMVKILAKQGYLPAAPGQRPDVILAWQWGTMNVSTLDSGNGLGARRINEGQLLRFLGGSKLGLTSAPGDPFSTQTLSPGLFALGGSAQNLLDIAKDDLYVAVISAYAADLRDAKHAELLWNTRISAPSRGFWLPDALPAMLAIASPYVGRETTQPVWIRASDKFRPEIHLGDLRVVEYLHKTPAMVAEVGSAK